MMSLCDPVMMALSITGGKLNLPALDCLPNNEKHQLALAHCKHPLMGSWDYSIAKQVKIFPANDVIFSTLCTVEQSWC